MTKNSFVNALLAELYIIFIGWVMTWGTKYAPRVPNMAAPIAIISLFTLSAAVMGYLFCYTPLMLYFDGKKKQAVKLFLSTTLIFALFTAVALGVLFSGLLK